jgi:hypothetical protein
MKRGRENGRYAWGTIKIQAFLTQTLRAAAKSTFVYLQLCAFFLLWLLLSKRWRLLVQTTTYIPFLKFPPRNKIPPQMTSPTNVKKSSQLLNICQPAVSSENFRVRCHTNSITCPKCTQTSIWKCPHILSERYANFRELVLWSFIRNLHAVI